MTLCGKLGVMKMASPRISFFCTPDILAEKHAAKYGNEICLLDATYKTSRYALPLFFLCVKTNVDYCVVGSFVIQRETRQAIAEAFTVLHNWNPQWSPRFFMTDFSDPEIKAIEEVFESKLQRL